MKNTTSLKLLITGFVIAFAGLAQDTYAQVVTKRLPDGTVVYSDGSVRRPNGEMKYPKSSGTRLPDGTVIYPNGRTTSGGTRQQDGSIIYPDGTVRYPDGTVRNPDGTVRYPRSGKNNRTGWIPPGQAKKMYGSKSAREYAPGHNKNKNHDYDDNDDDKGWKNKGNGKGKHK